MLDVRDMVRRIKLGLSDREIARDVGSTRRTVARYRRVARESGWLDRPDLPTEAEVAQRLAALTAPLEAGPLSTVEPFRDRVVELRRRGVKVMALWQILRDQHGFLGTYKSVLRFVRRLEPREPQSCVRVETPPGEEAQVDFGYVGRMINPRTGLLQKAWVFCMVLSFSRHRYDEIVFDQSVPTWLACHVHAFEEFGGVPKRLKIDNLKAAIVKACLDDLQVQRAYGELAEHYGLLISPCRVATPRHKGKVENGVHYVTRNALAGRDFADGDAANAHLKWWRYEVAGVRDHGTTHEPPLARFAIERHHLAPLPATRYEWAIFKEVHLHPDSHVVFEKAYYSAPYRLRGKPLLLRATRDRVEIYHNHERVASHPRATHPGQRSSNVLHYPEDKAAGLQATHEQIRRRASAIGASTLEIVEQMLAEKPVDRIRWAMGIAGLPRKYAPARVEAACRRALSCGTASYPAVMRILERGLDAHPLPPEAVCDGPIPRTNAFARPVGEIQPGLFRKE